MSESFEDVLKKFTNKMLEAKKRHDRDKADTWRNCSVGWLEGELMRQLADYFKAKPNFDLVKCCHELVSAANILCMLWNKILGQGET